ncbi:hypothetical protein AGMMS49944_12100 [Spirochaetia bacterium]|nr:hypothetical protein AGMMS49944_12100 [Spirochaetia bacterium]
MQLTEEQTRIVNSVLDDMYGNDKIFETDTAKWEEFKAFIVGDTEPGEIESLMELCNEYQRDKMMGKSPAVEFAFIMLYDMWVNKSSVWPVPYNPEWEKGNGGTPPSYR